MEDITFVRRTNKKIHFGSYDKPFIRFEYPQGRFTLSKIAAKILGVDIGDGLMFGFNRVNGAGFVIKDDEPDAFILRRKGIYSLGVTSKELQDYFVETFDIVDSGKSVFYFSVSHVPNDRGLYPIYLV